MEEFGVKLSTLIELYDFKVICNFDKIDLTSITVADVTRPGLQLAGHFKHFGADRIQLVGNMEMAFLESLTSDE